MSNLVTLRPKPGDVVERVYHVECELWSDSTSTILGAVVPATGKRYALRCWLDSHGADSAVAMQQFVRVANFIRLFEQPGIIEVFGVGRTNGVFYSVTEWLEGTTLERYLERNGRLQARDALAVLLPCLEGLAAAHNGGITHGDVRPANVYVCRPTRNEPERARLGKFDCGRWPERETGFKRWLTEDLYQRQFVSPEELQGATPDARTDVYAVGLLLYVTIAGQSPFSANSLRELDRAIITGASKPLSASMATVSPGLAELIARAMSRDPEDRFNDMPALLTQLARIEGHDHNSLAKYAPEITNYRWITPASECVHPSLFDLPVVGPDEVDDYREARFSRVLRMCLVLSLGLLSVTLLHRIYLQPEVPLLSVKQQQRILARPVAEPAATASAALEFTPLVVPVEVAQPEATDNSSDGLKAERNKRTVVPAPPTAARAPLPTPKPVEVAPPPVAAPSTPPPVPAAQIVTPAAPAAPSTSSTPISNRHAEVLEHMQLQ